MRTEFPSSIKKAALARANGLCEGCTTPLQKSKYHFDHVIADALTGKPLLENCKVLCVVCHAEKTKIDVANIAQAKRREAIQTGTKGDAKWTFGKRPKQPTVTTKEPLARRPIYLDENPPPSQRTPFDS